ncbi:MAG: winged helix-turn-helix transcriptional regulator [Candidatus Bathyarchaeota archaeon]|nr:winged helix-turn-helix transcriptional regulator [Candidatus Bathyarchaeota archaeon]
MQIFKGSLAVKVYIEKIMDKTDIVLCQLLLSNSRLSYSELAETLNLSVTAVHKRIQDLTESGMKHGVNNNLNAAVVISKLKRKRSEQE